MINKEVENMIIKKIPNVKEVIVLSDKRFIEGDREISSEITLDSGKKLTSCFNYYPGMKKPDIRMFEIIQHVGSIEERDTEFAKKMESLFFPGVKETKKSIENIRKKSIKLPKKSLKLESVIHPSTIDEMEERIKEKLPEARNFRRSKKGEKLYFRYKNRSFIAELNRAHYPPRKISIYHEYEFDSNSKTDKFLEVEKMCDKIQNLINATDAKDSKQIIKQIKDKATKLPKKTLKLEALEFIKKEHAKIKKNETK